MISMIVRATLLAFLLLTLPTVAMTQSAPPQPSAPQQTSASDQLLKPQELEALVAPVALYPDNLLSLVLMASTYPLEVVQEELITDLRCLAVRRVHFQDWFKGAGALGRRGGGGDRVTA